MCKVLAKRALAVADRLDKLSQCETSVAQCAELMSCARELRTVADLVGRLDCLPKGWWMVFSAKEEHFPVAVIEYERHAQYMIDTIWPQGHKLMVP